MKNQTINPENTGDHVYWIEKGRSADGIWKHDLEWDHKHYSVLLWVGEKDALISYISFGNTITKKVPLEELQLL